MEICDERENGIVSYSFLEAGDCFEKEPSCYYMATSLRDKDGDFYAVNLRTGEQKAFVSTCPVVAIEMESRIIG